MQVYSMDFQFCQSRKFIETIGWPLACTTEPTQRAWRGGLRGRLPAIVDRSLSINDPSVHS